VAARRIVTSAAAELGPGLLPARLILISSEWFIGLGLPQLVSDVSNLSGLSTYKSFSKSDSEILGQFMLARLLHRGSKCARKERSNRIGEQDDRSLFCK
jgi:hypothetical protein